MLSLDDTARVVEERAMQENSFKWRCRGCQRLLAVIDGDRVEIRLARGHQYLASLPVTCACSNPRCNALNELQRGSTHAPPAADANC